MTISQYKQNIDYIRNHILQIMYAAVGRWRLRQCGAASDKLLLKVRSKLKGRTWIRLIFHKNRSDISLIKVQYNRFNFRSHIFSSERCSISKVKSYTHVAIKTFNE
jgi:hypothetical protein